MSFWVLPPEINSGRLYTGPGSAPMIEAASAWGTLSSALYSTATEATAVIASVPWSGPSATAMRAAWTRQQNWLLATAAQAEHTATQARTAATAYENARTASVHPALVAANRTQLASLIATNVLGQNAAAIMALESQYTQMWAQDIAAMSAYLQATQAAPLQPFTSPTPLWDYLLGGQTLPQLFWGTAQSNISSGPWQAVTELLGLFTVFWGVSAATSPDSPLAQIFRATINTPPTAPTPPPTTPLPRTTPIHASVGTANRAAGLSMPRTEWAAPTPAPNRAPTVRPIPPEEHDTPIPLPLPVGVPSGGTPTKQQRPEPDYGLQMRFVPRPPAGG